MIKEIKVSNFTKAAGLDMIIAHRLLKNKINSNEYILITSNYHKHFNKIELQLNLNWQQSSENYPAIGEIVYRYALLDEVRRNIPYPPKRILPVIELGEFTAKVRINDSMKNVYSKLIDLDERINWMVGLDKLERDEVTERVGLGHTCYIQGDTIEFITVKSEIKDKEIIYAEDGKLGELGLQIRNTYYFKSISKNVTSVELDLKCIEQKKPSEELLNQIMKRARANLERFKEYCERQN